MWSIGSRARNHGLGQNNGLFVVKYNFTKTAKTDKEEIREVGKSKDGEESNDTIEEERYKTKQTGL